jgi:hypothetical protein
VAIVIKNRPIKHAVVHGMISQNPDYSPAFMNGVAAGILTYHREVIKPLEERIKELERRLNDKD